MKHIHITTDGQTSFCGQAIKGLGGRPSLAFVHPEGVKGWQEGDPVEGVDLCPTCLDRPQRQPPEETAAQVDQAIEKVYQD